MHINWEAFTPWASLAGGALIGAAVSILLLMNGRVLGVSGIVAGLFKNSGVTWRWWFIAGVFAAPWLYGLIGGALPQPSEQSVLGIVVAGLLVGVGTRLGSGCTSGHGVCGLARLSKRSLAATVMFIVAGGATVYLLRHVWGGL
ncbi:YeeE/YedE family protein [Alcaligenaceae bacterium 429]|uniref:YeeE/YedE family protein n=1 Tax=Paenalcaligenes sp. Me52 TaxID=3392038 RepID=UPI001091FFF7|nr:YeeE/YedE family protein [Alcaligenaceae bacterium 429]